MQGLCSFVCRHTVDCRTLTQYSHCTSSTDLRVHMRDARAHAYSPPQQLRERRLCARVNIEQSKWQVRASGF